MYKIFTAEEIFWKVMKICATQGMVIIAFAGSVVAHGNEAQILERSVTLNEVNSTLEQVLDQIELQASVQFYYSIDQVDLGTKLTTVRAAVPLGTLLRELLTPLNINYIVHEADETIILKKASDPRLSHDIRSEANAQVAITGRVTDTKMQPMAGVNVVVRGTTTGTATDADGRFSITVHEHDILVFSFIGFVTLEIKVGDQTVVDITLQEDVQNLNEVVINAGYYNTTRFSQTGTIGKVGASELEKQPVSNSLAALQGRIAGLQIIQDTGVPGGHFTVRIRGRNSISSGNEPLYIVDGVPFTSVPMSMNETSGSLLPTGSSPLNGINTADIESIEILKDADATSIYGSRGANGVILITTKSGTSGKTKFDFNMYAGAGKVSRTAPVLGTDEYLTMRHEGYRNDARTPTAADAPDLLLWDTTRYTDWQKELIGGTANTTNAQFTMSGGDPTTQFAFGLGYRKETTVFPGVTSDQRLSSHFRLANSSFNQKLKISLTGNYSFGFTDLIKQDLTALAITLEPNAPELYDENGNLNWENSTWTNPLAILNQQYEASTSTLISNGIVSYQILPGLEIRSSLGYSSIFMTATTTTPKSSLDPSIAANTENMSAFTDNSFTNWIAEPQLNWKLEARNNRLEALVGGTFMNQATQSKGLIGTGFVNEALMMNIASASVVTANSSKYAQYRYVAGFGRLNYSFKNRYILNLTGRRDGSSRFGPDMQFGWFGALGSAWIFSEEPFFKGNVSFINFGKLRASIGTSGNDQIGDYAYLDTYETSGPYLGKSGLVPSRLYNPGFSWESNTKMEVALDLGMLNDRIQLSINLYRNQSSNQLVAYSLPPAAGFTSILRNLPAVVENRGTEVTLSTTNMSAKRFRWLTSFNFTAPQNELVEYPGLETSSYANAYVIGQPLSIRKLYETNGVDEQTGLMRIIDVNEDGALSVLDRQKVVNVAEQFFGGLQNTLEYNGIQLDFLFQYVKQNGNNYLYSAWNEAPGWRSNQPVYVLDRWQTPGDLAGTQRYTSSSSQAAAMFNYLYVSDLSVSDASFIRLKNLSLSFTLPETWIRSMESCRFYLLGQNLLTFTAYKGLDPEHQNSVVPPLRVITGGVQIKF